jgi:hypothetical protein
VKGCTSLTRLTPAKRRRNDSKINRWKLSKLRERYSPNPAWRISPHLRNPSACVYAVVFPIYSQLPLSAPYVHCPNSDARPSPVARFDLTIRLGFRARGKGRSPPHIHPCIRLLLFVVSMLLVVTILAIKATSAFKRVTLKLFFNTTYILVTGLLLFKEGDWSIQKPSPAPLTPLPRHFQQ